MAGNPDTTSGIDVCWHWVDVCAFADLVPDRGVCALVEGEQVAIFRTSPGDDLYALSNYDPCSDAFVLSRGIVGSKGDVPKVASPIHKQSFDLRTGACLDRPDVTVATWAVRRRHCEAGDRVEVARRG